MHNQAEKDAKIVLFIIFFYSCRKFRLIRDMVFLINQKFCWPKRGLFEKKRIIKNLPVLRFDAFLLMFQIFVLRFSSSQCFLSNWGGRTYLGVSGSRLVKVFLANSKKFLLLHAEGSFTVERDKLYAQKHG